LGYGRAWVARSKVPLSVVSDELVDHVSNLSWEVEEGYTLIVLLPDRRYIVGFFASRLCTYASNAAQRTLTLQHAGRGSLRMSRGVWLHILAYVLYVHLGNSSVTPSRPMAVGISWPEALSCCCGLQILGGGSKEHHLQERGEMVKRPPTDVLPATTPEVARIDCKAVRACSSPACGLMYLAITDPCCWATHTEMLEQ
jgi:hypothetical protein